MFQVKFVYHISNRCKADGPCPNSSYKFYKLIRQTDCKTLPRALVQEARDIVWVGGSLRKLEVHDLLKINNE